jgi:selenide, water dikinase
MSIDLEKRKKVMARSTMLGHCVCNPGIGCPCNAFKTYSVCSCAGEKKKTLSKNTRLTNLVKKTGCASKIGQSDLLRILQKLPPVSDPNVLVGMAAGDDAGVYRLGDGWTLVQTVDVFTPCVDTPYLFGQIAAANSVSDIYAMGGKPLTALSIIGFPIDELDGSIMEEMLKGGMDKLREAGCSLIGGHSINDDEIKLGFAVTGLVDEKEAIERGTVAEGDLLVLTKPLGTGIICFGAQLGRISNKCLEEAGVSMATLNKDAAELMGQYDAHACTDITGFGLTGHLKEMIRNNGLGAEIDISLLPVFSVVEECLEHGIFPGAVERNEEYNGAWVVTPETGSKNEIYILYDPQTSGGLLVSLPEDQAFHYVKELKNRGVLSASVIGKIYKPSEEGMKGKIYIKNSRLNNFFGSKEGLIMENRESPSQKAEDAASGDENSFDSKSCCESTQLPDKETSDSSSLDTFNEFMRLASSNGNIDKRSKKLIAIALSAAQRCRPCLVSHIKSARVMGISKSEIEEAAALAIAFSGAPSLMMYKEVCKEIYG